MSLDARSDASNAGRLAFRSGYPKSLQSPLRFTSADHTRYPHGLLPVQHLSILFTLCFIIVRSWRGGSIPGAREGEEDHLVWHAICPWRRVRRLEGTQGQTRLPSSRWSMTLRLHDCYIMIKEKRRRGVVSGLVDEEMKMMCRWKQGCANSVTGGWLVE